MGVPYTYQTNNGDAVILSVDRGVCSTTPAAGESVNGEVVLHLGHFQAARSGTRHRSASAERAPRDDSADLRRLARSSSGGLAIIWGLAYVARPRQRASYLKRWQS